MKFWHNASFSLAILLTVGGNTVNSAMAQTVAPPNVINFQGRLATPSGNPVTDGTHSIKFSFYDAATSGNLLFDKTIANVAVKNGTFAVKIDSFTADKFNGNAWMGISINGATELAPRTQIISVPYALKSNLALSVADGSITNANLAGNITADKLASGTLNGTAWLLGGNSGTDPSINFIGTTNSRALVFKTNNVARMRIDNNGYVGIGTNAPQEIVHVAGSPSPLMRLQDTSVGGKTFHFGINSATGNLSITQTAVQDIMTFQHTTGNVGIGTTPSAKLDIQAPVGGMSLRVSDGTRRFGLQSVTSSERDGYNLGTLSNHALYFATNDVVRGQFDANGLFRAHYGMTVNGAATLNNGLTVNGGNLSLNDGGFFVEDGLVFIAGGALYVEGGAFYVTTLPFGDYRNVQWDSLTGRFYYDNSSRRHKTNITPLEDDFGKLLQARAMTYTRPNAPGRWEIGFIAEDFDAIGLKKLVDYGKNGEIEGINYEKICLYLTEIAKRQGQTIEQQSQSLQHQGKALAMQSKENAELKTRLNALENTVAELKTRLEAKK